MATGYLYMITVNVDVEDGIVNGAIGTLRHIEIFDNITIDQPSTSSIVPITASPSLRVWTEFPDNIGRRLKIKSESMIMRKPGVLDGAWIPIALQMSNISLGGMIKCRRIQFPLTPACALTIHKSQGGTFDSIVYNYSTN